MKLCRKCSDAVKQQAEERGWDIYPYTEGNIVPDSECEFWAHIAFNTLAKVDGWKELDKNSELGKALLAKADTIIGWKKLQ